MIYRFSSLNENILNNLNNGTIFFQDPFKFNDPFEFGQTLIPVDREEYLRETGKYSSQVQYALSGNPIEPEPFHKVSMHFTKDKIPYAVFSATTEENKNSTYMWSRYGQVYSGVCIGYDFKNYTHGEIIKFHTEPTFQAAIKEVNYVSERPRVPHVVSGTANMRPDLVAWEKGKEWEVEKEVRLLTPTIEGVRTRTVKFPDDCLKEIIIGYKANIELIEQVMEIANKKYPGIPVLRAKPHDHTFAVVIERFT